MSDCPARPFLTQAMILAAGFGKRLHPLTLTTPKPLILLAGKPLLQHTAERLMDAGVNQLVVNSHYLADQVHAFLDEFGEKHPTCAIIISHESELLETGGAIAKALPHLTTTPFLTVNSDIWWQENPQVDKKETAGDIFAVLRDHWDDQKMDALLAVVHQKNALFYEGSGDFHLLPDGQLQHGGHSCYNESRAPYIYTGIQLIHPRLLQQRTGAFGLPLCYREAASRQRLYGIELKGKWSDVGTPKALMGLGCHLD